MINEEFRDHNVLQRRKFTLYNTKDKGMTEEMYYKVIPREYVYKPVEKFIPNVTENERVDTSTSESEGEQPLQNLEELERLNNNVESQIFDENIPHEKKLSLIIKRNTIKNFMRLLEMT